MIYSKKRNDDDLNTARCVATYVSIDQISRTHIQYIHTYIP